MRRIFRFRRWRRVGRRRTTSCTPASGGLSNFYLPLDSGSWAADRKTLRRTLLCSSRAIARRHKPLNSQGIGPPPTLHVNRQRSPLHKICLRVANIELKKLTNLLRFFAGSLTLCRFNFQKTRRCISEICTFEKAKIMTQVKTLGILGASLLMGTAIWSQAGQVRRVPLTFALDCANGDCPLLNGTPETSGMRGGSVKLRPGESVGWHTTGANEEALVILHGTGAAKIEGRADLPVHEKMMVYIPPDSKHNVANTGTEPLEYVWVVAPTAQPSPAR